MRRWEQDLRPECDRRGIRIVTVSSDTVEELQSRRHLHGLKAQMLADFDLAVTDAFGLRNELFHSAPPGDDQEALAVPTTLLVDGAGKVLWMDQSENYQQRSDPELVLAALRTHLD